MQAPALRLPYRTRHGLGRNPTGRRHHLLSAAGSLAARLFSGPRQGCLSEGLLRSGRLVSDSVADLATQHGYRFFCRANGSS